MKSLIVNSARKIRNEADRILVGASNQLGATSVQKSTSNPDAAVTNVLLTAAFGSMGDDALRAGTVAGAASLGEPVKIWVPGATDAWPTDPVSGPVHSLEPLRLGQTGILPPSARKVFGTGPTVVIGADTIGGDYLHGFLGYRVAALRQAVHNGYSAKLVNFSMGSNPTATAVRLLRSLPSSVELWARDTLSQERTKELLNRYVEIAPDIGALAKPVESDAVKELVTQHGNRGYVVLVPNAHFETLGWFSRAELIEFWVSLAEELSGRHKVVILPHDVRERPGDIMFARQISEGFERRTGLKSSVFVPASAGEAKGVLGSAAGVVAARMHACVGALSSGVPCVGLEYLGKFVGQFKWFGNLGKVVPLESSVDASAIATQLRAIMDSPECDTLGNPVSAGDIGWLRSQRSV